MSESPYQAAHGIPLIKSPSLRVPPPVVLPQDIHPLPDSVNDYFVYPFTLESLVTNVEASRRATLSAHAARRQTFLRARDEEKERRKREALRRIAPGFDPSSTSHPLVPTRGPVSHTMGSTTAQSGGASLGHQHTGSVMDDLVNQLAALNNASSSSG